MRYSPSTISRPSTGSICAPRTSSKARSPRYATAPASSKPSWGARRGWWRQMPRSSPAGTRRGKQWAPACAFPCGRPTQSGWFRNGEKWRTGCEGRISVVKRRYGLNRAGTRRLHWLNTSQNFCILRFSSHLVRFIDSTPYGGKKPDNSCNGDISCASRLPRMIASTLAVCYHDLVDFRAAGAMALTEQHPIQPTSRHCHSVWQPRRTFHHLKLRIVSCSRNYL